jgi:iron complex outermembrane receptor protein
LGAVISSSACAQAADDAALQLPAITVTAEKRARALEDVPASIAVINGWDIEQSGIIGMEQLEGRVPGLSFQPFGQAGMNSPVMRGLTANFNTFSTSTLLLVDGVPTLTAQGFENGFLDLDRIEVLRGPQSTLYGRNAEAGVIALHSQPMDNTPRASITGEIGSRDRRALRFALSRPVVEDKLYASISGSWFAQDGFIDNTYTAAARTTASTATSTWACAGRPPRRPIWCCATLARNTMTAQRFGERPPPPEGRSPPARRAGTVPRGRHFP